MALLFDNFYTCRPSHQLERMRLRDMDLLIPLAVSQEINRLMRVPRFFYQPRQSEISKMETGSEVAMDKDEFEVNLNVQHFSPEEITVKTSGDNTIIVEAKHEEKQDEHGHISRQIVRKYVLPKGHDINEVQSKLSSDGMLTITAPKVKEHKIEERRIPIQQTDVSSKSIENKEMEDGKKPEVEDK